MKYNPAALSALAKGDFENAAVAATPGGIEAQEKAGQQALVASTNMPKELHPSREAFEKLGFKFGDDVDELFVSAELPAGWSRAGTDHAMHSDILDEKGRKRVGVFYKAAFYDRRADASLTTRYRITVVSGEAVGLAEEQSAWAVMDAGTEVYRTSPYPRDDYDSDRMHEAKNWLKEHYPDADDPLAYW